MSALIQQNHDARPNDEHGVMAATMRRLGGEADAIIERFRRQGDPEKRPLSVGDSVGIGSSRAIRQWFDKIGYPQCRVWGAEAPLGRDKSGCPLHKKLCVIPMAFRVNVSQALAFLDFEVRAKLWFWPIILVDGGSTTDITVTDLTYTGDPVFENGTGTGPWVPSAAFNPQANWNVMPGLPAIDNTNGLIFRLVNSGGAPVDFQGMFLGISIRN